jgi:N utilization substance protein A
MKLGQQEILYMKALDEVAGVSAKDCLIRGNQVIFLVDENEMGKAIGRKGILVKRLSISLGKQVELIAYGRTPERFVKTMLKGLQVNKTELHSEDSKKTMAILMPGESKRKLLNSASRLKKVKELLQRNYGIDTVRLK